MWSHLSREIIISTADQKVHLLSGESTTNICVAVGKNCGLHMTWPQGRFLGQYKVNSVHKFELLVFELP